MRKQDGNDWKFVRKNDYQRLETVVEESSKISSAESSDSTSTKRSYLQSELERSNLSLYENDSKFLLSDKSAHSMQFSFDKHFPAANNDLNSAKEILPIFSNNHYTSKDALSIDGNEDSDGFCESVKGCFSKDENLYDRKFSVETFKNPKTSYEKDILRKTVKVRTLLTRMSSHFVKHCLLLTPRQKSKGEILHREREDRINQCKSNTSNQQYNKGFNVKDFVMDHISLPIIICTVFSIILFVLFLVKRFHRSPSKIEWFMQYIPFMRSRRTHTQIFFDKLLRIISRVI